MRKPIGYTALKASLAVLADTVKHLETLIWRGDLSQDKADEKTSIRWMMRAREARNKCKNAIRKMEREYPG